MNRTMFVMIGGYKGAGKNTVTDEVMRRFRETYPQIHVQDDMIALPIKEIAKEYYRWRGDKGDVGRALLQVIGDVLREVPDRVVQQVLMNMRESGNHDFNVNEARGMVTEYFGGGEFDPLFDHLLDRTNQNYPNQIIFVTDTRMMFEFTRLDPNRNPSFWIHADWAKPSGHITESINPNEIPGIRHVTNIKDSDHAIRKVFDDVVKLAKDNGFPI